MAHKNQTITIENNNGLQATFIRWGARWTGMYVPDKYGNVQNVILGFDSVDKYKTAEEQYHGAVVGRYCGRIAYGRHTDPDVDLLCNDHHRHHLHGGDHAFHNRLWNVSFINRRKNQVGFQLISEDGEGGYPGKLDVQVTYSLTEENALLFEANVSTNKPTLVNLTNHAFFNLSGSVKDISGHQLWVYGDNLELDHEFLPTGKILNSTQPERITLSGTINAAYLLNTAVDAPVILYEPVSGRKLQIRTNQAAVQLYNGFLMTGKDRGKEGTRYYANTGLAIETQFFSPSGLSILQPHEMYAHKTSYEFI